jgi:hypothetical protein
VLQILRRLAPLSLALTLVLGTATRAAVAAGPDFSISASPPTVLISSNGSSGFGNTTVTATSINGFTGPVGFTVSGLPTGVTATVIPAPGPPNIASIELAASASAAAGTTNITVTGTSGSLSHSISVPVMVVLPVSDFTVLVNPTSATISTGTGAVFSVLAPQVTGFTGLATFTASGLPTGVTASFGTSTGDGRGGTAATLTLAASSAASPGTSTITVTGHAGSLTASATITLTVNFAVSVTPSSATISAGSSATINVGATPVTGFTGTVTFTAGGLPAGVTASFGPTTTNSSGASTATLTLTAASTASAGTSTFTVTGHAGSLTASGTITLTVVSGTGGVVATPVVAANGGFFDEDDLKLANSAPLTSLSVTIVVQRNGGVSFSGQYNTVGGQIVQSSSSTASTITYQFTLVAGQTLAPGSGRVFAAQMSGGGAVHPTGSDSFTVTYTTGGATFTQSGNYP